MIVVLCKRFKVFENCSDIIYRLILSEMRKLELGECGNNQSVRFEFVGVGTVTLKAEDIIYVETDRHRNLFNTRTKIYSIYKRLDEIEAELSDLGFVRIHQSFLVNMRYIEKISSYRLRLTNGVELSVPKARYKYVKKEYALFKGEQDL